MESRANYDMGGKDLERGVYMGGDDLAEARAARDREEQTRKSAIRSSMGGYGYVYTPPKPQPGLYLHSGRGIVQHIPGTEPHGGMPSWMSLPDPQYLCEKNGNNPLMPSVPASIPTTKTIMHMVENHTPTSIFDKDEGDSIHGDRVMGTLALPPPIGNSSKRWSQGSFGDRKLKRKKEEDEEAMNTKSNGTFFFD